MAGKILLHVTSAIAAQVASKRRIGRQAPDGGGHALGASRFDNDSAHGFRHDARELAVRAGARDDRTARRLGLDRVLPPLDISQFRVPPCPGDQLDLFG